MIPHGGDTQRQSDGNHVVFVRRMDRPNNSYPSTRAYEGSRVYNDNARKTSEASERSGVLWMLLQYRAEPNTIMFMNGYLV